MFSRTITMSTVEARLDVGQAADRADVGVEIERLAERDVDRPEAVADRRRRPAPSSATRFLRTDSITVLGSGVPVELRAPRARRGAPPSRSSTPAAARISCVAAVTSGPMPSPGMSVIRWVMRTRFGKPAAFSGDASPAYRRPPPAISPDRG